MAGRSPARFIAPLALVVFAIALVMVVGGSSTETQENDSTRTGERTRTNGGRATATPTRKRESTTNKTYRIKPGDTPSGIAAAHDMTVGELLDLNPDIDPGNLRIGSTIKVR